MREFVSSKHIPRRTILGAGGLELLTATSIASCDSAPEQAPRARGAEDARESPMLAEAVKVVACHP